MLNLASMNQFVNERLPEYAGWVIARVVECGRSHVQGDLAVEPGEGKRAVAAPDRVGKHDPIARGQGP